jgi:hypothetical protein
MDDADTPPAAPAAPAAAAAAAAAAPEKDKGKGGHRPKPRMERGDHKNNWVKTCVAPVACPPCRDSNELSLRAPRHLTRLLRGEQLLHLPGAYLQMVRE